MTPGLHRVCLSLGSNIAPEHNLPRAVALLGESLVVEALSSAWQSTAVGGEGPDFLNLAVLAVTDLPDDALRESVLRPIEARLGRRRTKDRSAPRTIDIDVVVSDSRVVDGELWLQPHLAVPVAELLGSLRDEASGDTLREAARRLARTGRILRRPDVL